MSSDTPNDSSPSNKSSPCRQRHIDDGPVPKTLRKWRKFLKHGFKPGRITHARLPPTPSPESHRWRLPSKTMQPERSQPVDDERRRHAFTMASAPPTLRLTEWPFDPTIAMLAQADHAIDINTDELVSHRSGVVKGVRKIAPVHFVRPPLNESSRMGFMSSTNSHC